MVRDAEANAEADKEKKEAIEVKNEIDSMTYSTEKSLKDHADKIGEDVKTEVEDAIKAAKEAQEGTDLQAMKEARDNLNKATSKIGQAIYGQGGGEGGGEGGEEKKEEDTMDAEFEDKKEEKK
ncbi:hypothetical protein TrCOL_g3930 [Triparma columacea]|uniref:Chaperone protein DnaK n=1 Tax=Triparma columacea TaxID=722753 RepID=A0A9W7L9D9_9STRA|nr:hypothetical protein TrCOL_g3930 [Triparma columacea]